ncbi:hypothetical protein [Methylobacterium sp. E-066]|uniref:hypothetical protein n=1 Tax=Methylobacterium sp. E-066 TaxID=2836584 RepID=UPI001FBA3E7A|nr:hypothetical protein [Methylobacterium sp. E-066]MCJ2142457.1 hypothetical protein [Methylobacterium sp. E-066]
MQDTAQSPDRPDPGYTQDDWDAVCDNPVMTDAELAELRPASAVPEVFRLLPKRGRPSAEAAEGSGLIDHSTSSGSASTTRRARS